MSAGDDGTFVKRLLAMHSRTCEVRRKDEGCGVQTVPERIRVVGSKAPGLP